MQNNQLFYTQQASSGANYINDTQIVLNTELPSQTRSLYLISLDIAIILEKILLEQVTRIPLFKQSTPTYNTIPLKLLITIASMHAFKKNRTISNNSIINDAFPPFFLNSSGAPLITREQARLFCDVLCNIVGEVVAIYNLIGCFLIGDDGILVTPQHLLSLMFIMLRGCNCHYVTDIQENSSLVTSLGALNSNCSTIIDNPDTLLTISTELLQMMGNILNEGILSQPLEITLPPKPFMHNPLITESLEISHSIVSEPSTLTLNEGILSQPLEITLPPKPFMHNPLITESLEISHSIVSEPSTLTPSN